MIIHVRESACSAGWCARFTFSKLAYVLVNLSIQQHLVLRYLAITFRVRAAAETNEFSREKNEIFAFFEANCFPSVANYTLGTSIP